LRLEVVCWKADVAIDLRNIDHFGIAMSRKSLIQGNLDHAIALGIKAIMPGLSLSKILSEVGEELKHQGSMGAHELAAALFNGSAFVMYPRQGNAVEDPQHGLPEKEVDAGREM
jgi:hypothetical protein